MRVKMRTTACGPDGNLYAGRTYDLDDAKARSLLDGGFAERVGLEPQAPEVAVAPTEERAVQPEPAPKRRGRPKKVSGE